MRYKISSFDHLQARLAEIQDDPSQHWSTYPCLLWDRAISGGYGSIWIPNPQGKPQCKHVSRAAYELIHGSLSSDINVCHRCDQPRCFRPIHLFAGTQRDNMRDCIEKGRFKFNPTTSGEDWEKRFGQFTPKGEIHGHARLKDHEVLKIRSSPMLNRELSAIYGVSESTISSIRRGEIWRHLL